MLVLQGDGGVVADGFGEQQISGGLREIGEPDQEVRNGHFPGSRRALTRCGGWSCCACGGAGRRPCMLPTGTSAARRPWLFSAGGGLRGGSSAPAGAACVWRATRLFLCRGCGRALCSRGIVRSSSAGLRLTTRPGNGASLRGSGRCGIRRSCSCARCRARHAAALPISKVFSGRVPVCSFLITAMQIFGATFASRSTSVGVLAIALYSLSPIALINFAGLMMRW